MMKNKVTISIVLACLFLSVVACSGSFTTANISSFNFSKNEKGESPTTTFNLGEKVYAVATVSNAMGKHKLRYKVYFENVEGKKKGEEATTKDLDFEGSYQTHLSLDLPLPGEYKVEAILMSEDGKEIEKKSGTFSVKGTAPAAATKPASDDAANKADDKKKDADDESGDSDK